MYAVKGILRRFSLKKKLIAKVVRMLYLNLAHSDCRFPPATFLALRNPNIM
jgi:hypothetical protein